MFFIVRLMAILMICLYWFVGRIIARWFSQQPDGPVLAHLYRIHDVLTISLALFAAMLFFDPPGE